MCGISTIWRKMCGISFFLVVTRTLNVIIVGVTETICCFFQLFFCLKKHSSLSIHYSVLELMNRASQGIMPEKGEIGKILLTTARKGTLVRVSAYIFVDEVKKSVKK